MRYKSNLEAPDLSAHFKLLDPPKQILGHDAPSDPDFEPGCTYWTHDEAAILFSVAKQVQGHWVDVGSRYGWTGAHLIAAGNSVTLVDPIYRHQAHTERMENNLYEPWEHVREVMASDFDSADCILSEGAVIDGNHDSPFPLRDAAGAASIARVIMLHDFWGKPIRDAANWLLDQGWNCRVYWTPNGVACLWRGLSDFAPPDHVCDPALEAAWENIRRECEKDFDFGRTK